MRTSAETGLNAGLGVDHASESEFCDQNREWPTTEPASAAGPAGKAYSSAPASPHHLQISYRTAEERSDVPVTIDAILAPDDTISQELSTLGFNHDNGTRYTELPGFYQSASQIVKNALGEKFSPGCNTIRILGAELPYNFNLTNTPFPSYCTATQNKAYILANHSVITNGESLRTNVAGAMQMLTYEVFGHAVQKLLAFGRNKEPDSYKDEVIKMIEPAVYGDRKNGYLAAIRKVLPLLTASSFSGLKEDMLREYPPLYSAPGETYDTILKSTYLHKCVSHIQTLYNVYIGHNNPIAEESFSRLRYLAHNENNSVWAPYVSPCLSSSDVPKPSTCSGTEPSFPIDKLTLEIFTMVVKELKVVDRKGMAALAKSSHQMLSYMDATGLLEAERIKHKIYELSNKPGDIVEELNDLLANELKRQPQLIIEQRLEIISYACALATAGNDETVAKIVDLAIGCNQGNLAHGVWYACTVLRLSGEPEELFKRLAEVVITLKTDKEKAAGLRLLSQLGAIPDPGKRAAYFDELVALIGPMQKDEAIANALWFVAEALPSLPDETVPDRLNELTERIIALSNKDHKSTIASHLMQQIEKAAPAIRQNISQSVTSIRDSIKNKDLETE